MAVKCGQTPALSGEPVGYPCLARPKPHKDMAMGHQQPWGSPLRAGEAAV